MIDQTLDVEQAYREARSQNRDRLYNAILKSAAEYSYHLRMVREGMKNALSGSTHHKESLFTRVAFPTAKQFYQPFVFGSALAACLALVVLTHFQVSSQVSTQFLYDLSLQTSIDDIEVSQMAIEKGLEAELPIESPYTNRIRLGFKLASMVIHGNSEIQISDSMRLDYSEADEKVVSQIKGLEKLDKEELALGVADILEKNEFVRLGYWLTLFKARLLRVEEKVDERFFVLVPELNKTLSKVLAPQELKQFDQVMKSENNLEAWYEYSDFLSRRLNIYQ